MPEAGGKKLAEDLRIRLPDLRKLADELLRMRAAGAVTAFTVEAGNVAKAIKSLEDEADAMRQVANDMLGNNPPETTDA